MAFPTSPSDGDIYSNAYGTTYKYVSADDKWVIISQAAVVEDDAYGAGWDGDTTHAPSQNAVYDELAGTVYDYMTLQTLQ